MSRSWAVAVLSLVALIHPLPAQTNPTTTIPIGGNTNQYAPTNVQHDVGSIGLVGSGAGWAVVDEHLFWTSNDGNSWKQLMPGTASQHIDGVFFLDQNEGWVSLSQKVLGPNSGQSVMVARTNDGGSSWTVVPVKPISSEPLKRYARSASIFFLDGTRGWLTMRLTSSSNFSFGLLFATNDGGNTWLQLPDPPAADPVYFSGPMRGWIAGGPGRDRLWKSSDGGRSWQEQKVKQPAAAPTCTPTFSHPKFQSSEKGVLPLVCREDDHTFVGSYKTQDGGQSWEIGPVFERGDVSNVTASTVVDSTSVAVFASHNTIVTISGTGARVLATLPSALWSSGTVADNDFADQTNGWIVYSSARCAGFKSACSQQNELLTTQDAGRTYKVITPVIATQNPAGVGSLVNPVARVPPDQIADSGDYQNRLAEITADSDQSSNSINQSALISGTAISQGEGFDQCQGSTAPNMQIWWGLSPYTTTGIYIGGNNMSCTQPNLNPTWINQVTNQGWGLMPIWVGPQAPVLPDGTKCSSCTGPNCKTMDPDPTKSAQAGISEADSAVSAALALGINQSVIYYDMEQYTTGNSSCSAAVSAFINAWVQELNAQGFPTAGAYGAPGNASADWTSNSISNPPDALWFAAWDNKDSIWDPARISNSLWPNHQRIHQFCSDGTSVPCKKYGDSYGGIKFSIDGDVLDAPVVPSQAQTLPAPVLQSPANGATGVLAPPTFSWSAIGPSYTYRIAVATTPSALPIAPDALSCSGCVVFYPAYGGTLTSTSYTPAAGTLAAGTTYYWQVQARGLQLGQWSSPFSFTMGSVAYALTGVAINPPTLLNSSYATITVTLNGLAPSGGLSVGLSSNNAALPVPSTVKISAGQTSGAVQVQAGSVSGTTTVTVTATYKGSTQTSTGTLQPGTAVTTTTPATSVTGSGAALNGTINPLGANGKVDFQWGTDPTMSTYTDSWCNIVNNSYYCPSVTPNSNTQAFSYSLSGLSSSTIYYYRFVAADTDNNSLWYGNIVSFPTQ